jgi:hypothetical protein
MMKNTSFFFIFFFLFNFLHAEDIGQTVQGSTIPKSELDNLSTEDSPYINSGKNLIIPTTENDAAPFLSGSSDEETTKQVENMKAKSHYKDIGYTVPGTFEKENNYIEIDKANYTKEMRLHSRSSLGLSYIRDGYTYTSPNNVIERTITYGYKHVQSGFLLFRYESYINKNEFLDFHWSLGSGLSYNYGRGIFASDGERSETGFQFWEVPMDFGLGANLSFGRFLKISATAGPSVIGLVQNRSDFSKNEKGKNKVQFGFGQFASLQLKMNLHSFAPESSYERFITDEITASYFYLEGRYHSYNKFLDSIEISGASVGAGFSFEFL